MIVGKDKLRDEFIKRFTPKIQAMMEEKGQYSVFEELVNRKVEEKFNSLEPTMEVDMKKMREDMRNAMMIPEEDLEKYCFMGVEMTNTASAQLKAYLEFADRNLSHG